MSKKHLTNDQRYTIFVMYQQEYKQKDIAVVLAKCKSVISHKISRNSNPKTCKYHHFYDQDLVQVFQRRFRMQNFRRCLLLKEAL